jgi:tetratricopeptide (TPR) repeat protein
MLPPSANHPSADDLAAFGLGKLDDSTADWLVSHLGSCQDCRQALDALSADTFLHRLRAADRPIPNAESAAERGSQTDSRADTVDHEPDADRRGPKAQARPSVPGYEILEELGHGGMGIVYKARHLQLNRVVALKMIRKGDGAHPDELTRFRTEATAVARLEHANIVQIHEIGQHDGLPFITLEFVDGGSLQQRLRGEPQAPNLAAEIVERLARAMHYAHQRHVVHRDLKPANILLKSSTDGRAELSSFVPKIADFGLAKQLDVNLGQTRADAIMGTPNYMAPEQAAGRSRDIGPPADVYALGAILYEMLVGRPPFRCESILETLEQVRSAEPTPPSKLQPRVPRDLETICLKCLAKEPAQRYSSALALAQDLERFRAGEPILGRRERSVTRLWRRIRRNPIPTAALAAVVLAAIAIGDIGPRAIDDRQKAALDRKLASLTAEVEDGLREPRDTEPYLLRLEGLIAEVEGLAPDRAAGVRDRLHQRFADRIRQSFRDRLAPEDMPRIESAIAALASRSKSLADAVEQDYRGRRKSWEPLFELKAPFENLASLYDAAQKRIVKTADGSALARLPSDAQKATSPFVYSLLPCPGNVKQVVVFDPSWAKANFLWLVLNRGKSGTYQFGLNVVSDEPAGGRPGNRVSFEVARKTGRLVHVHIHRETPSTGGGGSQRLNYTTLSAAELFAGCAADGSLRLEASREADRLSFQVNRGKPLEFSDSFPLSTNDSGVFGMLWPEDVRLRSLQGYVLPTAALPGLMDAADDRFNEDDFEHALEAYVRLRKSADTVRGRQEARYKEAICLRSLKRERESLAAFEELAHELSPLEEAGPETRWPLLAYGQLLLHHARMKTPEARDRTNAILDRLMLQHGNVAKLFAVLISPSEREQLVYGAAVGGLNLVFRRPNDQIEDSLRAVKAAEILEGESAEILRAKLSLVRAYHMAGRDAEAMRVIEPLIRDMATYCVSGHDYGHLLIEQYCWILRSRGDEAHRRLALKELDQWLFRDPRDTESFRRNRNVSSHLLLLERARLHAELNEWDAAEKDVARFLRDGMGPEFSNATVYLEACLMLGFFRDRRGDKSGALEAWRDGLPRGWARRFPENDDLRTTLLRTGGRGLFYVRMLMALAGAGAEELAGEREGLLPEELAAQSLGGLRFEAMQVMKLVDIPADVFERIWKGARGKEWAKKIVLRELSQTDFYSVPIFLMGAEIASRNSMGRAPTDQEQEILLEMIRTIRADYADGKLKEGQIMALASEYKGIGIPGFGWDYGVKELKPSARAALAYFYGQRLQRLGQTNRAVQFFRAAVTDSLADTAVRALAQAELGKLTKAPTK